MLAESKKKTAIKKAAEIIRTFEELAKTDPKINMKKLRQNVLKNLHEENKDIEPSESYWSY